MSKLLQDLSAQLPPGMVIPDALRRVYDWIEAKGMLCDNHQGVRVGLLFPHAALRAGWSDTRREGGTDIQFYSQKVEILGYWFGFTDQRSGKDLSSGKGRELLNRLCIFAQTGADGSMAAFWLGDDGKQRIVHLGSGSGSTLVCVLAEDALDFLRLVAIGYDEICWPEPFAKPPNTDLRGGEPYIRPNLAFQEWVKNTFGVTIPRTALEIVKHAAEMEDDESEDLFFNWTKRHCM
jgi:hypothetical protein